MPFLNAALRSCLELTHCCWRHPKSKALCYPEASSDWSVPLLLPEPRCEESDHSASDRFGSCSCVLTPPYWAGQEHLAVWESCQTAEKGRMKWWDRGGRGRNNKGGGGGGGAGPFFFFFLVIFANFHLSPSHYLIFTGHFLPQCLCLAGYHTFHLLSLLCSFCLHFLGLLPIHNLCLDRKQRDGASVLSNDIRNSKLWKRELDGVAASFVSSVPVGQTLGLSACLDLS